jgi:hypothetical protein
MALITAGARSRFGYLFGSASAKPILPAKAKVQRAQPRPAATRAASSKPEDRPADFSHLLKAARTRDVEQLAPIPSIPRPRTLGERHRAALRARGETVPDPVDALPEQPTRRKNTTSTLGERVAALHKKMGRI